MSNSKTFLTTRAVAVGLLLSTVWVGCQPAEITTSDSVTLSNARSGDDAEYVEGELVVQFAEGVSDDVRKQALNKVQGKAAERILTKAMEKAGKKEGLLLLKVKNVMQAVADLANTPGVEFAEPNYIYHHTAVSTDPFFTNTSLWGMYGPSTSPANQFGSNAAAAWAAGYTGSSTVYVGIIDEGIQYTHPDLDGQVGNPLDPAGNGDDDGNGLVDDTYGWDFANNDATVYDGGSGGTLDNHGTHVSGTIGGKSNSVGVVGVNWNVKLISGKFLGASGGTLANAVKAIDYFTNLKTKGLNIVATNNSWGGGSFSQALLDAITRANAQNILFVAAAGNSGTNNDRKASYPSNYNVANVIAVAAIDKTGALASFSQYGATTVDLGAPGVAINSTTAYNTYSSYSGTSMATPHVTGAVALYASVKPGATASQIKAAILNSAVPTTSLARKTVTGGRLDVNAALAR
ncbi:S8 family peptidase [Fibrivirga algicola]|uniref:S8 family serine peptidase n=1 Tax=Fibrivirga algicola TaxID=2950420 RepID=A0ABX0QIM4_9BACT|nr:S8 family peptidase [Fibrivirga algicola]NID10787.1 S8 family serine peptidase [Fibrivirga algicola]